MLFFFVFLYFKGCGGFIGYGNIVVLFVGGRGDEEVLLKENVKNMVVFVEERFC